MFRGTYLDFKEKADILNSKFHKLDKKYLIKIYFTNMHIRLDKIRPNKQK